MVPMITLCGLYRIAHRNFPITRVVPASTIARFITAESNYPGAPSSRFVPSLAPVLPVEQDKVIPTFRVVASDGRLVPELSGHPQGKSEGALPSNASMFDNANVNQTPSSELPVKYENNQSVCEALDLLGKEDCIELLQGMIRLRVIDALCLQAHRQGRVPFYAPSTREEAAIVGTAAALSIRDEVFSQYREHGLLLYRIVRAQMQSIRTTPMVMQASPPSYQRSEDDEIAAYLPFMRQNVGSANDIGRARQMAMHYGSAELGFQMVSSTIATQIPHAAGAAYALKRAGESHSRITVTFFGDGGSSEGDFHGGLNIAATMEAPVMFMCRNNGFAISTPTSEQYRCDGIAGRAAGGYGIVSYRVDGNDAIAVLLAVRAARNYIVSEQKPAVVELMTYRGGDHSTSDDSSMYRDANALEKYPDPITRFSNYLEHERRWWDADLTSKFFAAQRRFALRALEIAEQESKPSPETLFDDVYSGPLPQALQRQKSALLHHLAARPNRVES